MVFLLLFFCSLNDQTRAQCSKGKKEVCACSWKRKGWGTGCYFSWESFGNSLSCPRSKLSKPLKKLPQFPKESTWNTESAWRRRSEKSAESHCPLTISPGAELLPSSVKRSAVYDLKMILHKLICQESPIEKAIRGFKWVNMKLLNCYCVFLFFSVKSWMMSQHQHEGGETYNNHISSGKWSLFGWCLSKAHILLGKKGNACFVGWP